jgi:hypothetical protein
MNRRRSLVVAAVFLVLITAGIVWLYFSAFDNDDAYITYRYARNMAKGKGLVYNDGERVLGTTTPLFAILIGSVSFLYNNPVFWGKLLSSLFLGIIGFESIYILSRIRHPIQTSDIWFVFLAPIVLLDPLLLSGGFGSETFLHLSLIVGGFCFLRSRREILPGILLGLSVLSRGDGIIAAAVFVGIRILYNHRIPWRTVISIAVIIGLWTGFALHYYGSPIPGTMDVKQLQAGVWHTRFLDGIRYYGDRYFSQAPTILILVPLAVMGGIALIRRRDWLLGTVAVWGTAYLISYALLDVPYVYIWYYSLVSPVLVLLAIYGIRCGWGFSDMPGWWKPIAVLSVGIVVYSFIRCDVHFLRWLPYPRHPVYREAGEWIRNTTPDSVSVAAFEVGAIGYYSERRIVDLWGLVTKDVARKTLREGEATWAMRRYHPDILIFQTDRWGNELAIERAPWFERAYEFDRTFRSERFHGIDLFRLVNPAVVPGTGG